MPEPIIENILSMMEDPVGMTDEYSGGEDIEATMMIMPGDGESEVDMDMGRQEETCGFAPEDYNLARELVAQVGGVERARELLENLEEVVDALDLDPIDDGYNVDNIADQMPEDPDLPTSHHNSMAMAGQFDAGHL